MAQPRHQVGDCVSPAAANINIINNSDSNSNNKNNNAVPSAITDLPMTEEDPAGHSIIPAIRHIGTSIFVPLDDDPSDASSFTPPANREAELHQILAYLDEHTAAVGRNLFDMIARDAARIAQDARRQDSYLVASKRHPGDTEPGLESPGRAAMISNMRAQPREARSDLYNLRDIPNPNFDRCQVHNPREWAANHVMRLIMRGTTTLETYEQEVKKTRAMYEQELKKERDREPA
ncbi:hypothetical protein BGZ63DRAFT_418678 [Mariannaea sp. PMI_226]|nr:hypothetical protein BGZ63DRAFT_418678 [Mariannaea sp. PMI_226]